MSLGTEGGGIGKLSTDGGGGWEGVWLVNGGCITGSPIAGLLAKGEGLFA
jgi:hypothetical protein